MAANGSCRCFYEMDPSRKKVVIVSKGRRNRITKKYLTRLAYVERPTSVVVLDQVYGDLLRVRAHKVNGSEKGSIMLSTLALVSSSTDSIHEGTTSKVWHCKLS